MGPNPGDRLLHYELVEKIGEGGMGVVWRARDRTLGREVAIKILPPELSAHADRLARFEREARLLAMLNHPNVAQVYGFHEDRGVRFLAMELVPGVDLARSIRERPLDVDRTVEVGLQVAAALEAAHSRGVVHRDLKPANVVLTPDGKVKVLDFGLARIAAGAEESSSPDLTHSPTITVANTVAGTLLGTAAYMSPEQARGRPTDKRTDMWAFGCVLYECLTGRTAFAGETISDTLAAILRGDPDWSLLPSRTPRRLRELMARCLAKDPDQRQRDAGDAALELQAAMKDDDLESVPASSGSSGAWKFAAAVLGLLLGLSLLPWIVGGVDRQEPRVVRSTLQLPEGWWPMHARISPNGRYVGVVGEGMQGPANARVRRVFVRDLTQHDAFVPVDGEVAYGWVRFSPDSTQIAFAAGTREGAMLSRAPSDGSAPPVKISRWEDSWPEDMIWLSDRELATVAMEPSQLVRIPLDGRAAPDPIPVKVASTTERFLVHEATPDGAILGTIESWSGGYHQDAMRLDPDTGEIEHIVDRGFEPTFLPPGLLLFSRRDQLLAASYSLSQGKITSPARVVESGLRAVLTEATAAAFSLSDRGDLLHIGGGVVGLGRRLVWLHEDGTRTQLGTFTGALGRGELDDSQDGSVVAFVRLGPTELYEILALEVNDPIPRRVLVKDGMDCQQPVVSPKGTRVAAICIGDRRKYGLYLGEFPTADPEGRLLVGAEGDVRLTPSSWTPDGKQLFVRRTVRNVSQQLILDVPDDASSAAAPVPTDALRPVEGLDGDIAFAMVSPDGSLIGFTRWDQSAWSIEVAPWDGKRAGFSRPIMRSRNSGFDWTGRVIDGHHEMAASDTGSVAKRLLIGRDGRVMSSENVKQLASTGPDILAIVYLNDGRILATEVSAEELEPPGLRLITHWTSTLF